MRVFGTKSTTYSAPRYNSVWPRWRPKPLTSVTVIPETPISDSAARTSSSLKGLMIAVINFIADSAEALGREMNPITILRSRHDQMHRESRFWPMIAMQGSPHYADDRFHRTGWP